MVDPRLLKPLVGSTFVGKILIGILPVVLVSLGAVTGAHYIVARDQISKDIRHEIQMLADQVAIHVRSFVEQRLRDLDTVVENPLLADYYKNVNYGLLLEAAEYRKQLYGYLQTFSNRTQVYSLLLYLDAQGRMVAGVREGQVITDPDAWIPPIGDIRRSGVYRSPVLDTPQGDKQMVLAKAVFDEGGEYQGAIVLMCDLRHLESQVLNRTRLGVNGRAYLVSRTGRVVLGSLPERAAELRQQVDVPGAPWQVVVQASPEEFLAPIRRLRDLTILFSLGVAVVVTAIIVARVRRVTRPIKQMAEGTRRLAGGDLTYRFPVPRIQELQILAVAFNDMAAKLKVRNEELESRIRQLTYLRTMDNVVLQGVDEPFILRTCLEAVARGLTFDRAALYWVEPDQDRIVGRYVYNRQGQGLFESSLERQALPLGGDDALNEAIRSRAAVLVRDCDARGLCPLPKRSDQAGSFVAAPLCGKDRVFGVIVADNGVSGRPLTESDRDGLMLFASTTALAVENSTLIERLAKSEARHRMVLDNSPIAIMGLSRDQRITTWNKGAEQIFGYAAQQVIGQPLRALFPPEAEEEFRALMREVVDKGTVREYPITGLTRTGDHLELSLCWGGSEEAFWANQEWAVVIRDVTESKRLQRQLILSEKLSAVGQLIAGIAHELNNPLQAVVGFAQLLSHRQDIKTYCEREVRHIYENAVRCRRIIDNLLLFVRHEETPKRAVPIQEAIQAALDLLEHKITRVAKADVKVVLPNQPLYAKVNYQQLQQVFVNLINNACDAMEEWSEPRRLTIRACRVGQRVRVEVVDTGPGIRPEWGQRVFEPFFTTKPEGRGTGLGLSLCRQILEDHGGSIGIDASHSPGTAIWFELPAAEAPSEALADPDEQDSPAAPSQLEPSAAAASILLIEDEASVRDLLTDVLSTQGHQVQAVSCLEAAIEQVGKASFDLVLTDVQLDDGDGIEFFRRWRIYSKQPRPPFLFITGDIMNPILDRATHQESGMMALQKPVDLNHLRATVESLLTRDASPQ